MKEMRTDRAAEREDTRETNQTLWLLAASPTIWAMHFLACYLTAAIWCAKVAAPGESIGFVRALVAAYTIVALVLIGIVGFAGYRRHRHGFATVPHDFDTPEDRHRFLGFAAVLLSGLSFVATLFVVLAAVFLGDCR